MRIIGKKLITKKNVSEFICEGSKEVYLSPEMILTSEAKDILRNKGIAIHYSAKTEDNGDVRNEIENVLKNEFGINQKSQLQQLTDVVLKKYNNI